MTLELTTIFQTAVANALSGLVSNIFWIILIIYSTKQISKSISKGVNKIPDWITQYEKIKNQQRVIDRAYEKKG